MRVATLHKKSPVGYDVAKAWKIIESDTVDFEDWKSRFSYEAIPPKIEFYEFSEDWLSTFPRIPGFWYLAKRGISRKLSREFDIRIDPIGKRVCFPVRTFDGVLAGLQGRDYTEQSKRRYHSYPYKGHSNSHIWLNENNVTEDRPIVLTEGPIDCAKVFEVYRNVLAGMTSQITRAKFERLSRFSHIVTFFDKGIAGDKARKKVAYFRKEKVLHVIPPEDDPGVMTESEIRSALEFIL